MLATQMKRRAMLAKSKAKKNKSEKEKEELVSTFFTEEYKTSVSSFAYLGKKGYTIPKECLRQEDIEFLKTDLYVKAETHGPKYGVPGGEDDVAFPVYKENSKKIYIPRFYGIERYGLPEKSEISEGQSINVDFVKELRDYQCKIIDIYVKHVLEQNNGGGGILEVPCGAGKTVMALNIISKLKKKTLIIVHKEFLMNQWIERAQEFIPTAKIGKIQGPIFDVEGKDVVIGMLQTLYDREFPENAFECFGLTIVDEVHRIGSEQFSKTLLRVITKNMLGISATVDRKDGLTKILHMFIGPKIYSEGRKNEDPVCVRAIDYISSDPEFNTVEYDFRGNAKYSTMITKLCNFGPRSDFIVRVLGDLIKENPEKQIMVLCHNRSLLKYLYEAILHRAFATTGYYVGGMKQKDLQMTEEKQIVLATYAMAAEALDIKTLSTLVMVTPKTDIIQSVGRILRVKHENPIIVDIVDRHDVFQNQFRQRKTFYRKCNYRIVSMDSVRYQGFPEDYMKLWTKVFEPRIFECKKLDLDSNEKIERKCLIQIEDTE
jgi:superfamily II DNA or RNA helicase